MGISSAMKFHLIILSIFVTSGFAGVTIKEFEGEFNELWSDPNDEKAASEELAEEEGALENPEYATGLIETPEEERNISPEDQAYLDSIYEDLDRQSIPSSYDARTKWLITKPKNQMSCGSCAAFAATATHETCMRRAGTPLKGLV